MKGKLGVIATALVFLGCGSSPADDDGGVGGMDGAAIDGAGSIDGAGAVDGATAFDGGADANNLLTITGQVTDSGGSGVAGGTAAVHGEAISVVADGDGDFSIEFLPGTKTLVASGSGFWGYALSREFDGDDSVGQMRMTSDAETVDLLGDVGATPDTGKGVVSVLFSNHSGTGGESASLTATAEGSGAVNSSFQLSASTSLIAGGGNGVIFYNVDVGTTQVSVSGNAGNTCTTDLDSAFDYPVIAKTASIVRVTCVDN